MVVPISTALSTFLKGSDPVHFGMPLLAQGLSGVPGVYLFVLSHPPSPMVARGHGGWSVRGGTPPSTSHSYPGVQEVL